MTDKKIRVHIVSHTHWDREWYLSSDYTNKWLVPFFDKLFSLLESNKNYKFVLDGQMQMINDYLSQLSPDDREKKAALLQKYGKGKQLFFGPYWSQIDWRIAGSESIVRNILIGRKFAEKYGNFMNIGWLLDDFGQVGQAPQIHKLSGIDSVFVWRGVNFPNDNLSSEFLWESPDGSKVIASYFLNSYRNLMGLTTYPDIASHRVKNEVKKMEEFLTTPNVLLMNGYDLDNHPEDPFSVIKVSKDKEEVIFQSSPAEYINDVRESNPQFELLKGELLSGRYLSVFPGTLSSRVYLKIWNYLCEYALTKLIEPIGAMVWHFTGYYPHDDVEKLWRQLITNETHDNISGVCIDQIHAQMEKRYEKLMNDAKEILQNSLSRIVGKFPKGATVAFNTNPFPVTLPLEANNEVVTFEDIPPLGYKVMKKATTYQISSKISKVEDFSWENDFYSASINPDGTLNIYDKSSKTWYKNVGYFYDEGDAGDEYNYSPPSQDKIFTNQNRVAKIHLLYETPIAAKVKVETQMDVPEYLDRDKRSDKKVTLTMIYEVSFDTTPLIKYHLSVKNVARDHRLKMTFPTAIENGKTIAEMPFEYVNRPEYIDNSKPIPQNLQRLLIGARECEKEYTFPMKDFVAIADNSKTFAVMTRGLSEYEVRGNTIFITLLRASEWIARSDLKMRIGDAGPAMYTPDAQCLREIRYDIGVFVGKGDVQNSGLTKWTQIFHNPPLILEVNEGTGKDVKEFSMLDFGGANLKLTATKIAENDDGVVVRLFNPHDKIIPLELPKTNGEIFKVDLLENPVMDVSKRIEVAPNEIVTLKFKMSHREDQYPISSFHLLTPELTSPVSEKSKNAQDPKILKLLRDKRDELLNHFERLKLVLNDNNGLAYHERMFELLCTERTCLEIDLSILLNEEITAKDEEKKKLRKRIEEVGLRLNDSRIKRRSYEYVLDYWKAVLKD